MYSGATGGKMVPHAAAAAAAAAKFPAPQPALVGVLALVLLAAVSIDTAEAQPPHPQLCPTPKTGEPCLAPLLPSGCGAGPLSKEPWCDRSKPTAERAAAAVKAMNLTEKIANTGMPTSPLWADRWNLRLLPGSRRLGIPSLLFGEIAHGVASPADPAQCLNGGLNCSTSFPATPVLAAAFDRALWREVGAAAGLEGRAWSNGGRDLMGTIGWAPNINGFRDPRWGRGQETPGEDIFLSGEYAVQFIHGLQNGSAGSPPSPHYQIIATAKHYLGYDMTGGDTNISDRWAAEYYLPQFEKAIKVGGVREIMTAHVAVNGVRMAANQFYNQHIARDAFGFTGLFTSDCGDVRGVKRNSSAEVCKAALEEGGLSVNCGGYLPNHLEAAVQAGTVSEDALDAALTRTWEASISLGNFDTPNEQSVANRMTITSIPAAVIDSPAHRKLALTAAQDGMVLLKNDAQALPLKPTDHVALLGPAANATFVMQSNYQGYSRLVLENSPLLAMQRRLGKKLQYAAGCGYGADPEAPHGDDASITAAVAAAKSADAAVVIVGIVPSSINYGTGGSSQPDPNAIESEGHNRLGIVLPGRQQELIARISAVNRRTIVVFIHGGAVTLDSNISARVPAFLDANYPGQAGGEAIAGALLGEFSPNGRLAYTIYAADFVAQRPDPTDHYLDSPPFGLTYMYWRGTPPLFGFGTGLTYAEFRSNFQSQQLTAMVGEQDDEDVVVAMNVWRTRKDSYDGEAAKFSVLLFASYTGNTAPGISTKPLRKLVGFEKVSLHKGERTSVQLRPSLMRGLALVADNGAYLLHGGEYVLISPGSGGAESDVRATLTLHGSGTSGNEAAGGDGVLRVDGFLPAARKAVAQVRKS